MGTVDRDAIGGEAEERLLLGVVEGDRLEGAEDDGVVGDYDGVFILNCFFCDSFGKVDCEQDRVLVAPRGEEGCFEEKACVVEGFVCEYFGIERAHGRGDGTCEG